ncbi:hypothetical protein ALC56_02870, partial [Trachymyrmex septentrionalis]
SFAMIVQTFIDLQEFIIGKKFIVKEMAMLRQIPVGKHITMIIPKGTRGKIQSLNVYGFRNLFKYLWFKSGCTNE